MSLLTQQCCCLCQQNSIEILCPDCTPNLDTQHRCYSCAIALADTTLDYCAQCLLHGHLIHHAWTLYNYQEPLVHLIKQFKYQHRLFIGQYFAQRITRWHQTITRNNEQYSMIIPMPLHKKRLQGRGFNQSIELLSGITKQHQNLVNYHYCKRIKHTPAFSNLSKEQRFKYSKNMFKVTGFTKPMKKILLFDDVMTTGSSLIALATAIKLTQPDAQIDTLCLARAD